MTRPRQKRKWRHAVIQIFALYAVFCFVVFLFQRSLLYFPSHAPPASRLLPWLVADQTIGFHRAVPSPRAIWLMMHGNAGQASDRDYVLDHIPDHDALFVLEYPGYGARRGSPSKRSINAAAAQAFQFLRKQYPDTPVCVIGESLGSGPASFLATLPNPPNKIILITPFDSLPRLAARHFPFLPAGLLLLDRWDNIAALRHYQGELEIYAAENDTIIPLQHARRLSQHSPAASLRLIPGGHNDWSLDPRVQFAL
jgi:hypothetical protein